MGRIYTPAHCCLSRVSRILWNEERSKGGVHCPLSTLNYRVKVKRPITLAEWCQERVRLWGERWHPSWKLWCLTWYPLRLQPTCGQAYDSFISLMLTSITRTGSCTTGSLLSGWLVLGHCQKKNGIMWEKFPSGGPPPSTTPIWEFSHFFTVYFAIL